MRDFHNIAVLVERTSKNILQDLIHKGNGEYYIEVLRNNME